MRIAVVSGKKQHYHELVRELDRGGDLAHYWASLCIPTLADGSPAAHRWLAAQLQRRAPGKFATYRLGGVAPGRVTSFPWSQLLAAGIHTAMRRRGWGNVAHNTLFDRWAARKVAHWSEEFDLLHVCNSHALHSGRAAQRRGVPVLLDQGAAHRAYMNDLLRAEFRRRGLVWNRGGEAPQVRKQERELAQSDFLVVPSEHARRSYVARGFPATRIFVCPYGVDVDRFRPADGAAAERRDDTFRVLFVGGNQIHKGVPYLIDAMDRLPKKQVELVLVAPNAAPIQPMIRAAKCSVRHIEFLGHADLAQLIATCDVFCLPSLSEGFGMVVYEAMAVGLPAIVTTNVGAEVADGVEGYVVPICDSEALAERIDMLRVDPDLRARLGRGARERALLTTWAHYADKVRAAYRTILGEGVATP